MQGLGAVTTGDLLAAGQRPLMRLEVYYGADNYLATMTFDSGSVKPRRDEILSGTTSIAEAKVISVTLASGSWAAGNAAGTIDLGFCSDRFYDNEDIDGSIGGANILTVNNPDTAAGVDGFVTDGSIEEGNGIPDYWTTYGTPISLARSIEFPRTGPNSGRVGVNGAGDGMQMETTVYPTLILGKTYRISAWILWRDTNPAPPAAMDFRLGVTGDGTATIDVESVDVSVARDGFVEVAFTTKCTTGGTIRLYVVHLATAPYYPPVFYVDDVTIYEDETWINISRLGGKNYLKDASFSSGGARMSSNPMAAQFSAIISNEGSVFHPSHPTSLYKDYFQAGKKVRISIGGNYTVGGIKYWQRIIGVMDEPKFSVDKYELTIKGLDYTKVLADIQFNKEVSAFGATPIDNYWGVKYTTNSVSSGGLGAEQYNLADAMDIGGDANNVDNWTKAIGDGFTSQIGAGSPSVNVGLATWGGAGTHFIQRLAVVGLTGGESYKFEFYYRHLVGGGTATFYARQASGTCGQKTVPSTDTNWHQDSFFFDALETGNLIIYVSFSNTLVLGSWAVDNFSVKEVTTPAWHRYAMPAACTGIYYVELDSVAVWPGKQKGEGWYYDLESNQFYFDEDKNIDAGVNNLDIYYFAAIDAEDVLADILTKAGLYASRAAALVAMGAPATEVSIDRAWFESGETYLNSIKKLCERTNYRFFFKYNGDASFIAAPTAGLALFRFGASEVSSPSLYQDRNEILNRIVIEGDKVAELVGWEENMPSELKDEASDATSITAYGEHTKSIKNHLFQDLVSITAMCATLLAAYKDPKWYSRFSAPYNATPLELYDSAGMMEMMDVTLVEGKFVYHGGIIRIIDVSKYNTTYKIEVENILGQCMIVAHCGDIADKYEDATDADKSYAYVAPCATMVFADGTPAMRVCKCS